MFGSLFYILLLSTFVAIVSVNVLNSDQCIDDVLQILYDPTAWVVRIRPDQVSADYMRTATKASTKAKAEIPHELDIVYGSNQGQKLDYYGTDLPKGSPILVFLHGGYWQKYSKNISAFPVVPSHEAGIKTIVGGYDLAPNVTLSEIVQEIKELAVFVLSMAKQENCRNVWFCGHSAGGHLSVSLLEEEWFDSLSPDLKKIFSGVISISGIYNLVPLVHTTVNNPLHLTEESAYELSPMFQKGKIIPGKKMRALIVTAEHDSPAFQTQAIEYKEVLEKKKIHTTLMEVPGKHYDHFSVVTDLQYRFYVLMKTIIKLIKQS